MLGLCSLHDSEFVLNSKMWHWYNDNCILSDWSTCSLLRNIINFFFWKLYLAKCISIKGDGMCCLHKLKKKKDIAMNLHSCCVFLVTILLAPPLYIPREQSRWTYISKCTYKLWVTHKLCWLYHIFHYVCCWLSAPRLCNMEYHLSNPS